MIQPYGNKSSLLLPSKKELRAEMKRREGLFPPSCAEAETVSVWSRVESLDAFARAGVVLSYMDIPGEVPTVAFMERWRGSKRFAIPLVAGENLEYYEYDPSHLRAGYRGIMEPSEDAAPISPSEIDFALVPGVAFSFRDGRLWRMGRGRGFYDRALPLLHCPKMGIYFSFRLVDNLPVDTWDRPLDF